MQDGAPPHRSRYTLAYLRNHCPDFIPPEEWPPNSPDLNPMDYWVWGHLESLVHANFKVETIATLRERIINCWNDFPQEYISRAIHKWKYCLRKVVEMNGQQIEPYL